MRYGALATCIAALVAAVVEVGIGASSRADSGGPSPERASVPAWRGRIERLSMDLRGRRLDDKDRAEIDAALEVQEPSVVYEQHVDAWMDRDFFRRLASRTVRRTGHVSRSTFSTLSKIWDAVRKKDVYFLNRGAIGSPQTPCPTSEQRLVRPWWSMDRPIRICASSYAPEKTFDEIGFCGGQADPKIPAPPRDGCGCGPLLIACLPPHDVAPHDGSREPEDGDLDDRIDEAAQDEAIETVTEILATDQPYENILETTTTWQSGLVEFLYARREMLRELASRPYETSFDARWAAALSKIDLNAPPRWVMRSRPYHGAGVFLTTPVSEVAYGTYRDQMRSVLTTFLCARFDSVNVNRDVLLATVGKSHADVRALKVHESPMRFQTGCSGCHAPMDFGAAFLLGLRTPLFGTYPIEDDARGKLYVNGANDFRGEGAGFSDMGRLIAAQHDFASCTVDTAFAGLVGRKAALPESGLTAALVQTFEHDHHALKPVLRQILLSRSYLSPVDFE
jgi:hypothetical protein